MFHKPVSTTATHNLNPLRERNFRGSRKTAQNGHHMWLPEFLRDLMSPNDPCGLTANSRWAVLWSGPVVQAVPSEDYTIYYNWNRLTSPRFETLAQVSEPWGVPSRSRSHLYHDSVPHPFWSINPRTGPVHIKCFGIRLPLFFTEPSQCNNEVIWLLEFAAFFCHSWRKAQ